MVPRPRRRRHRHNRGKGANLAALARASLPVPRGFVITTAAYQDLVDAPEIQDALGQLDALNAAAAELRALVERREFDASVETAFTDAIASFENTDSIAVRSSATAEDLPSASFAGQHETFLGVPTPNRHDGSGSESRE